MGKKALPLAMLAFFIFLTARDSAAQFIPHLSELISRYEAFNRLYDQKRRAGQGIPQIEALRLRGEEAFRNGNLPLILETLGEGIAALEGKPWDEKQKFISSLTVEVNRLVVEPNQEVQFALARMYPSEMEKAFPAAPTVSFEIQAVGSREQAAGANPAGNQPVVVALRLSIAEGETTTSRRLRLPDGEYAVVAIVESGGRKITELRTPIYAVGDFTDRIAGLDQVLKGIKASSTPQVKVLAPLAATAEFQLQRLRSLNTATGEVGINVFEQLERIEKSLSAMSKGQNPYQMERGEIERAYMSSDGSLVPYRLYIPKTYNETATRPLVVVLHGAMGDERSYFSGLYNHEVIKGEAEKRGFIIASPNGRGRFSSFQGTGEEDVLEVIQAAGRDYKVDPARIYLTGHSIGGGGAWAIASNRPDLFAAIAPVSGAIRPQADALAALLARVKALPIFITHGARDGIIPPAVSRDMAAAAQKAGLKVEYKEMPDDDHITIVAATFPAVMEFFEKHSKTLPAKAGTD